MLSHAHPQPADKTSLATLEGALFSGTVFSRSRFPNFYRGATRRQCGWGNLKGSEGDTSLEGRSQKVERRPTDKMKEKKNKVRSPCLFTLSAREISWGSTAHALLVKLGKGKSGRGCRVMLHGRSDPVRATARQRKGAGRCWTRPRMWQERLRSHTRPVGASRRPAEDS